MWVSVLKIAIFLDTNIVESDFKMAGRNFLDLFNAKSTVFNDTYFKLYLTQTNFYEIEKHYRNKIRSSLNAYQNAINEVNKYTNHIDKIDIALLKKQLVEEYTKKIKKIFEIYTPSPRAYEKALERMYLTKMPFRDNKEELKDAIIWESIYDFALKNRNCNIYFISNNNKDFAVEDLNGKSYLFHEDFDTLDGVIKYKKNIKDFLTEFNYLYHFTIDGITEIQDIITKYVYEKLEMNHGFENFLDDFFYNGSFSFESLEGWGTEPYIEKIIDVSMDNDVEILQSDEYCYVPIKIDCRISYSVEISNPGYEPGDEDFLVLGPISEVFTIGALVYFNIEEYCVEYLDDFKIEFKEYYKEKY